METVRRHRASSAPIGEPTLIWDLTASDIRRLTLLEPSLNFKYLSNPWIHALLGTRDYFRTVKRMGLLREEQNGHVHYPIWQKTRCQNYLAKPNIYELSEKGRRVLRANNVPMMQAAHRSNSERHEVMIDMGFYAPLRLYSLRDPALVHFSATDLLRHPNVPEATRSHPDPFLIDDSAHRFDGAPFLLQRDGRAVFFAGIEVDRNTKTIAPKGGHPSIGGHIKNIMDYMAEGAIHRHYGIKNPTGMLFPILTYSEHHMENIMAWVLDNYGEVPILLFQHHKDLTEGAFFPKPSTDIITKPWRRIGKLKPYSLAQLKEIDE